MTATCRLLLGQGAIFLLGLDSSAPLPPPHRPRPLPQAPPTPHHHHPPAPSLPHYTAHQPLRGPKARVGSSSLWSRFPAIPHPQAHTAPDKASPQPCRTLPPAVSPHPAVGTLLIGLWVWGGVLSPFFPLTSH